MRYYWIITVLSFFLLINIFSNSSVYAAGSDVFSPYVSYNRLDSDNLDTGTIAFKGEMVFDFVFHKLGEDWYTSRDPLGINKFFNYKSTSSMKTNKWEDTYGQTFYFNVGMKPVDWFFAEFGFAMIGDYADKYWVPVNHEHRMETWNQKAPRLEWNNARVGIKNDWASLTYYKNYGHMDWRYDGDMFNLYPVSDNPDDYIRYSGHHTADYWDLRARGVWGDLNVIYGEEPLQDYKQGIYVKYKNIFGSNINFYYADHQIPFGNPNASEWNNLFESSLDLGDYKERMRTFELSTDFKIARNTLQVGAMYRPFRLGWDYLYVEDVGLGNGVNGSRYKIYENTTDDIDALGGSVKFSMPKKFGLDLIKVGYEYRGLVAGNRHKVDASVEKQLSKYWNSYGAYSYQKPLIEAMPLVYSTSTIAINARGPESPFWVWWRNPMSGFDNRETSEFSFVFTYDPTPSTWFYRFEPNIPMEYNLNPEEDSPFSFAAKINFARYFGALDRQTYWEYDGSTVWEDVYSNGTSAPDRYVGSLYFLSQFVKDKVRIIYDFEVGEDLATLSYAYPDDKAAAGRETFIQPMIGYFKTSLSVRRNPYFFKTAYFKNLWGPEDWHKNFGSTYDELYLMHLDRDIGKWFNVGMEYAGARKTNRAVLDSIEGKKTQNEMGYFDEVRMFVRILFDATLKFGSKDSAAPFVVEYDKTPPQVALKAKPDLIYPENNQKTILEPWASDHFGIDIWNLYIKTPEGEVVKTYSGTREPPYELEWNGRHETTREALPDGNYFAVLEAVDNYGNRSETDPVKIAIATMPKIEDTEIIETERGLVITLGAKVLFDTGKFNLKKGAMKTLKEVADLLKMYSDNNISVEGHTDWQGGIAYNQKLSEDRAKSVRDFLVKEGVDSERIKMTGYGKLKPVATNDTAAGREQNRRVEIVILKDDGTSINLSKEEIEVPQ
ncbi:MAG: OmpA family protein [Endomicrobia bacterium]|nr:OmpA family protein [Endomicrobiia bacterium]